MDDGDEQGVSRLLVSPRVRGAYGDRCTRVTEFVCLGRRIAESRRGTPQTQGVRRGSTLAPWRMTSAPIRSLQLRNPTRTAMPARTKKRRNARTTKRSVATRAARSGHDKAPTEAGAR